MIPHTLEEQKALLTAEAEGKVVREIDADGARFEKKVGKWHFDCDRYEVEQPLMEEWKVVNKAGRAVSKRDSRKEADEHAANLNISEYEKYQAPFRVVHMREVRATQGPTP